jgi:hypothetical protein
LLLIAGDAATVVPTFFEHFKFIWLLIESGETMIELSKPSLRLQWPLLFIIVILNAYVTAAQGAGLRDIRIGEYEQFTRVVFEFDAAVAPPVITSPAPGRLSVTFAGSEPRLIRKIPDHRSALINAIELWHSGPGLTAALVFDVEKIRFEWFGLSDPDRIALDVYPLAVPATSALPTISAAETPDVMETHDSVASDGTDKPKSAAAAIEDNTEAPAQEPVVPTSAPLPTAAAPAPTVASTEVADLQIRMQHDTGDVGSTGTLNGAVNSDISFTHRLQFYLVIGLVVITVIILGLLVLMLLARHRLTKEATSINSQWTLQHQDERISTIDACIEQQLKYYDEI